MKLKLVLTLLAIIAFRYIVPAQSAGAAQLANHIAQKMKDTLSLTQEQKSQIYSINLQIHSLKMEVRQQYNNPDTIRVRTQRVESSRDSLYRPVLNQPQYQLYLQKKRYLISAN